MEKGNQRLAYIDCMRGLACILMFQWHCYDSWLGSVARLGRFYGWSALVTTLVAPSFLFLVGVSLALKIESLQRRGMIAGQIVRTTVRRGAMILLAALAFRGQEFLLGLPAAPWTDLLRVDVLNVIGVSIMLIGITCWVARDRIGRGVAGTAVALGIAALSPLLWTSWRPRWLPWFLESYLNGVHTFTEPQPWLFPIFPWTAFCFAGLATGAWLQGEWTRQRRSLSMVLLAAGGIVMVALALSLDALPIQIYRAYDFWHTSPNFFLVRIGILLVILAACYLWSYFAANQWGFTKLVQLGQCSLLVYWVHTEFVYGRFSILPKGRASILTASIGLLIITAAMVTLSVGRLWLRSHGAVILDWLKQSRRENWQRRPKDVEIE